MTYINRDVDTQTKAYTFDSTLLYDKRMENRFCQEEVDALFSAFMGGDIKAGHNLILSVLPLAIQMIQKYNPRLVQRVGLNDITHELFIGLLKSLPTYDSTRGKITTWTSLRTFNMYKGLRRLDGVVRVPNYVTRQNENQSMSFSGYDWSDYSENLYSNDPEPLESMCSSALDDKLIALYAACKTSREKAIIAMRLKGSTFQEIGGQLGLCRERIRQILNKIYERAKREFDRMSK